MINPYKLFLNNVIPIKQNSIFYNRLLFCNKVTITMPKQSKDKHQKTKKATACTGNAEKLESMEPVVENSDKTVTVRILAKPGAKQNAITGMTEEGVGIQIAAPPVDGEANTELVKYLSKLLGLRKSDVTLNKGSKSRNKNIIISGIAKDVVLKKLKDEIDET